MGFGKKGKSSFTVHRSEEVLPGEIRGALSRGSSSEADGTGTGGIGMAGSAGVGLDGLSSEIITIGGNVGGGVGGSGSGDRFAYILYMLLALTFTFTLPLTTFQHFPFSHLICMMIS